jgi:hypothetical protein
MSHPSWHRGGMIRNWYLAGRDPERAEVVATFGDARLLKTQRGRLEVEGGTEVDQREAWEWVERFLSPHRARLSRRHSGPGNWP